VERRRRDLGLRRCDPVAVEQNFGRSTRTDLARKPISRFESFFISTKLELLATLFLLTFQVRPRIKVITLAEMTPQTLWSRYVRRFVGITRRNVWS